MIAGYARIGPIMSNNKTVWSSEDGDLRKVPSPQPSPFWERGIPPKEQTAYLHRSSSGRGGKAVSLVKNIVLSDIDLKALAKKLKQECGTGGTIKDGVIEIQGEHRQ